jgi:hypothetical protein
MLSTNQNTPPSRLRTRPFTTSLAWILLTAAASLLPLSDASGIGMLLLSFPTGISIFRYTVITVQTSVQGEIL